jgi:hypothetical protein
MMRSILPLCLLPALLPAQVTATVPVTTAPQNVDRPWPGGIGRYQQLFSAASLQAFLAEPMRIQQVEFFAGSSLTANAATIDCEVLMAHGNSFLTGQFDNNYSSPPVVVLPRQNVQLVAGAPGSVVLTIPFTTMFTWDRQRPLLLEIRIHGNSSNNQPFLYNFRGVTVAGGATSRVYQGGSPGALTGQTQSGVGMVVRFTARPGVVLDFGSGCAGEGGFVPKNTVLQIPSPAILWTHQVSQAGSQLLALWGLGDSRTAWGPIALPVDFNTLLGLPPSGCMLLVNPIVTAAAVTVGGGAGQGLAQYSWQLAPTTSYVGLSVFSQWIVLDPLSPNGVAAVSQGVHSIVAPLGG